MRGTDETTGSLFSHVDLEERIPACQALGKVRRIVNKALAGLDAGFDGLCSAEGRPSVAPERLLAGRPDPEAVPGPLRAGLMERMHSDLLFRWFAGLGIDDPVWGPAVFSRNRGRLLTSEVARRFLAAILARRAVAALLPDEPVSVDGTLVRPGRR